VEATDRDVAVADLNAVSPATARAMGERLSAAGATFIDGSIIGPPPTRDGTTRIFVSGPDTAAVEGLAGHGLDVRRVADVIGAASALKMSFGALTKGTTALATLLLVAAERHDVSEALVAELEERQPGLLDFAQRTIPQMPMRSRRWVGEMEEIDAAFDAVGLPPGTFAGIAELYRWVGDSPLADETPENLRNRSLAAVIAALAAAGLHGADG
jgi:3-hydroxyisobutyrate dehydrogenase-like beta-hydroxyacid dehydrogenase